MKLQIVSGGCETVTLLLLSLILMFTLHLTPLESFMCSHSTPFYNSRIL
jgi:hypothetical protein